MRKLLISFIDPQNSQKHTILLSCNSFFIKCLKDKKKILLCLDSQTVKKFKENYNIKLEFKLIVNAKHLWIIKDLQFLLGHKVNEKVSRNIDKEINYFIINC